MKYNRDQLIQKLIAHEGMVLKVYQDTLGIDTIGIGRNLKGRGINQDELEYMGMKSIDAVYKLGITEKDAIFLANNDVDIVEEELLRIHPIVDELDEVRQIVLVDMAFNLGVPRLCKFKNMWAAVYDGDYDKAAVEMLDSRWATQVKSRAIVLSNAMREGVL